MKRMEGPQTKRRQRAVQLTDSALELLRARLQEERAKSPNGRLTREARADLMGVSVATAERILSRSGNDRTVLIDAFAALSLPWNDEYCQPLSPVPRALPAGEATLTGSPLTPPSKAALRPSRLQVVAVLPLLLAAPWLLQYSMGSRFAGDNSRLIERRTAAVQAANAGREAYHRGDYGQASATAQRVFKVAKADQFADIAADALTLEGDVFAAQGRLTEALEKYREALPLWSTFGNIHGKGVLLEVMAVTEARLGMLAEARGHFLEGLEILQSLGPKHVHIGSLRGLGSVAAVQGDHALARKWYDDASRALDDQPDEAMQTDLRALQALLLRDEGRFEEARQELEACLEFWRKRKHPRWQATTHRQIASVLILAGDEDRAKRHATQALKLYNQVGDSLGAAEVEKLITEGREYVQSLTAKLEDYF